MRYLFVILVAITLSGCVEETKRTEYTEVTLPSGVKCVFYKGSRAEAAMSCDWSGEVLK
jgi:hypothetical protein